MAGAVTTTAASAAWLADGWARGVPRRGLGVHWYSVARDFLPTHSPTCSLYFIPLNHSNLLENSLQTFCRMASTGKRSRAAADSEAVPLIRLKPTEPRSKEAPLPAQSQTAGKPKSVKPITARTVPPDPFDIDKIFAEAVVEKAKAVESASVSAVKAEKKVRAAAAIDAAAAAAVRDLEVAGRKANRMKGADSPVPLRCAL